MKFLVDESTDARLADYLTELGHDARTVARHYTRSLGDAEILAIAREEGRILITQDRDFGELVFRRGHPHAGVIFFRLTTTRLSVKTARLSHILSAYPDQLSQYLVVTEHSVRVRRSRTF